MDFCQICANGSTNLGLQGVGKWWSLTNAQAHWVGKICREVFYCWLWDYVRTILKISVKPRRRTSGAQIYCVFQTRGRNSGGWNQEDDLQQLFPRFWFCISFFNQPWTVNQGRAVSFKRFTIPWNQCLGGGVVCVGDYGWTLPDASQTYFILWDIIDLPSPQIRAKTLFLVFFYCR